MAKAISQEDIQLIVTDLYVRGTNFSLVSQMRNVSRTTVRNIKALVDGMRSENYAEVLSYMEKKANMTDGLIRAVAEYMNIPVPEKIQKAMQSRSQKGKEARKKNEFGLDLIEENTEAPAEETPLAGPHPSDALTPSPCAGKAVEAPAEPKGNDAVYFIRILEELHQQNEYLKDLLDVVLPKYVSDLKDNLNANSDVLGTDLRGCLEELKAVRCNTRKRGL